MAAVADPVMECDAAVFQRDLNVLPYEIGHTLADHPRFQLEALVELAQRVAARKNPHMSGGDAYFTEGAIEAGAKPVYTGASGDRPEEEQIRAAQAQVLSTPGELRQVLANLVGNAVDAMRSGGTLRIRIAELRPYHHISRSIRITIADSGTGIPAEVLPTIFEPFVTTKGETGTGLGLWVTSEILKKNGWRVRVRSCRDPRRSGTVFVILIPNMDRC